MSKEKINPGEVCAVCQAETFRGSDVCACGAVRKRRLNPKEALAWNLVMVAAIFAGVMLIESHPVLSIGIVAVPLCLHFLRMRSREYTWGKR
jgi:hypothetical protein